MDYRLKSSLGKMLFNAVTDVFPIMYVQGVIQYISLLTIGIHE